MDKKEKLKYWEDLTYEEFKVKQEGYSKEHTVNSYTNNYFSDLPYDMGEALDYLKSLLLWLMLILIFPLSLVYYMLRWKVYYGSKLNYFVFRRLLNKIKKKNGM